jgi:hypothetical protein
LIGRRGAVGSISGAIGDFTIEEQSSTGANLTIHKNSGGATLQGRFHAKDGINVYKNITYETTDDVAVNFRPGNAAYYTTLSYQTGGNEALVFAAKNAVTSFIFASGEDSFTEHGSIRWQSLTTPGLQIKNNCVSIGALIANNVTPTYRLNVNGTTNSNVFRIAEKADITYNATNECINFTFV